MSPLLGAAIYIILWWLSFFMMLPVGAQSFHEADEAPPEGSERGAPKARAWARRRFGRPASRLCCG